MEGETYWEAGREDGGMVAWVLFEFDSPAGTAVPAAGAGGTVTLAGCSCCSACGAAGPAGAAPLCLGGLGM